MKRLMGFLGLCARARKLVSGEKACIDAIRRGTAYVAIIDGGISANGRKAIADSCNTYGVELIELEPDALGQAIGKEGRMATVVTDHGMAQRVLQLARL